ncbi:peptide/nickel transport system ATP-binding protein [Microbacteriaceae bacterium SG_E_30_P1]|uniref:Peptide/nickel transport system ATP-binding protein n=1 Tax=Antiquaquibacter oligotrophicus TaxID=2880260 RepID=A0ABT6KMJ5_9MICO|nr:ABC transporter ATP-binding protein [Antiquaquibacter oligotrophicus]MDH6181231.1 peptide/nickel transport system ATP-binding protein [Antiquaquibacter oligotrophicus]UDF13074.1 ABC transporter ATP-binding protein [Antiquaquibacter oligotrophicus]
MSVHVRGLTITLDGRVIVDGVDLDVAPGECLAIVGESGSGKTMTANALLGLTPAGARVDAETLELAGTDARHLSDRQWRALRGGAIGLVSQDALVSLDPLRTVGREVAEPIEVHNTVPRAEIGERVIELLAQVGVPDAPVRSRQYPHELSGGLRQRALIASALAAGPRVLIADEPTTALDATVQRTILDLLAKLRDDGIALVLISHDLRAVERLADRVAVMRDGRVVEAGVTADVMGSPQHPYTRHLLDSVPTPRETSSPPEGAIVLEARDLVRDYGIQGGGAVRALDGVSLTVRAGSTVGVVGESGSGKSTLARMLLAAEQPDAGVVLLDGAPWSSDPERRRRSRRSRIQLIDQDPFGSFDPRFTVAEIIGEAVVLAGDPRRVRGQRVRDLLGRVGLEPELARRRPRELSGGQRQRVAIARAIARRPAILVCDEPVSALDAPIQARVLELLESLQRDLGLAMVFISHDLGVIAEVSDEIVVMKSGRVVESGPATTVLGSPEHPFTRELIAASGL